MSVAEQHPESTHRDPAASVNEMAELLREVPGLPKPQDPAWREILAASKIVQIPADTVVFREGTECCNYVIVVRGSVRVQKVAESGRQIVLYRVQPGQTCVITTASLFAGENYPAEGVSESEVLGVAVPMARFFEGVDRSPGFRQFVFSSYGRRIGQLIELLEEVACRRVDARLAQWLLDHAADGRVESTHERIATELVTAREVVSRQLKEFETRHWVMLRRGRIDLIEPEALRGVVEGREC